MQNKKSFQAFSLVELSIVLVVLGLLTTGAFQGSALVSKARLFSARSKTRNSPVATIPDLTFWVEATSENSFSKPQPNDGELITLWKDINPQSTEPLDLDVVPSNSPIYKEAGINKLPSLEFFSNSRSIQKNNIAASQFLGNGSVSIFIVQKYNGGGAGSSLGFVYSGGNLNVYAINSGNSIYFNYGCCSGSGSITSVDVNPEQYTNLPRIIGFVKNQNLTNLGIFADGKLLLLNNAASTNIGSSVVSNLSVGRFFTGMIGEIIIFSRALTDSERQSVEAYLSQKWKIALQS